MPALFSKKLEGGVFVDVHESNGGVKYLTITTSRKKKDSEEWEKTRIALFANNIDPIVDAILEAKSYL